MNFHFNPDGSIDFRFLDGTVINSNSINPANFNGIINDNEEIKK